MKYQNHPGLLFFLILFAAIQSPASTEHSMTPKPLIVGGAEAAPGEFPFIASLQSGSSGHFCGGSLIRNNWVLTAGHCADATYLKTVWLGLHDQSQKSNAESFKVRKVIRHPQFSNQTLDYDFALIQLEGRSKFQPITINTREIPIPEGNDLIFSTTAGWGALRENSYSISPKLMKVDVPLVPQNLCSEAYKDFNEITDRMLCAGFEEGQKDACQGDSGGPLIVNQSGKPVLAGIVSWGKGCARPRAYGVYSKVNSIGDWIQENIND
jgi:trypsin